MIDVLRTLPSTCLQLCSMIDRQSLCYGEFPEKAFERREGTFRPDMDELLSCFSSCSALIFRSSRLFALVSC